MGASILLLKEAITISGLVAESHRYSGSTIFVQNVAGTFSQVGVLVKLSTDFDGDSIVDMLDNC